MSSPAWLGNLPSLPLCETMCRFSYSARLAVPPPFLLFYVKLSYRSPHLMLGKKAEKCLSYNYSCEETMRLCECSSCVPSRLRCNPSDFKQGFQGEVGDSGSSNQLDVDGVDWCISVQSGFQKLYIIVTWWRGRQLSSSAENCDLFIVSFYQFPKTFVHTSSLISEGGLSSELL